MERWEHSGWVLGALLYLFKFQTMDEQTSHYTRDRNDVGFNAVDAGILSSIAAQYLEGRWLSTKQINLVRKLMKKYHKQLKGVEIKPVKVRRRRKKRNPPKNYKRAILQNGKLRFEFSAPDREGFYQIVNMIKNFLGKKYDKSSKVWTAPVYYTTIETLRKDGWEVDPKVLKWWKKLHHPKMDVQGVLNRLEGFRGTLRPYQLEGVAWAEALKGRCVIGDDMGLGKTVQALAWLYANPDIRPAVIVCTALGKYQWADMAKKFCGYDPYIVEGRYQGDKLPEAKIYLVNYEILINQTEEVIDPTTGRKRRREISNSGWAVEFERMGVQAVVLDEFQYIMNGKALRTKAVRRMAQNVKHVMGLSGTPIKSKPIQGFNILNLTAPRIFPSYWNYAMEFCGARHNGYGWDFSGASNLERLHKMMSLVMIRRMKKDVEKDLPPKTRSVLPVEITNRKEYDRASSDFKAWLKDVDPEKLNTAERAEALVKLEKLKQLSVKGKMKPVCEWINDFLETGNKLVVFGHHREVLENLHKKYQDNSVMILGGTSKKAKRENIRRFVEDSKVKLFFGSINAMGTGTDGLQRSCSNAVFVELGDNPGDLQQAEDRLWRILQEKTVNIYYILSRNTVEGPRWKTINHYAKVVSSVLDGKEKGMGVVEDGMLTDLLKRMKGEKV